MGLLWICWFSYFPVMASGLLSIVILNLLIIYFDICPSFVLLLPEACWFYKTTFIGLLYVIRKNLCEARVKPRMSSNFQMMFPDKLSDIPPTQSCQ